MSLLLQAKHSQPSLFKLARHNGWASHVCLWKPVSTAGLEILTLSLSGHSEPHNLHDSQCSWPIAMNCAAKRDRPAPYGWTGLHFCSEQETQHFWGLEGGVLFSPMLFQLCVERNSHYQLLFLSLHLGCCRRLGWHPHMPGYCQTNK